MSTSPLLPWPPRAWTPLAVVFDCDGLLVDTESPWIELQDAYLASHGAALEPEVRRRITGRSMETVITTIAETVGRDAHAVADDLLALHTEQAGAELIVMPGALETVRAATAKVPVAIASNSPRAMLDEKLEALGLVGLIDASVAVEDVEHPKPAPDLYARGAELLGADPARTLALDDSETGARSATAAGLRLIAVPSLPGQEPEAAVTLSSLEDPDLHAWIDAWETRR